MGLALSCFNSEAFATHASKDHFLGKTPSLTKAAYLVVWDPFHSSSEQPPEGTARLTLQLPVTSSPKSAS